MPATETIDFEREFAELVRQLRALPDAAPADVRSRVRALGEPAARRRLPALPPRRSLLVLAPACVLALVAAAVVHGLLASSPPKRQVLANVEHGAAASAGARTTPTFGATLQPHVASPLTLPAPGRHQDYDAWLRLRVKDVDALTARTNEAMQVVRSYGGYVASVTQSSAAGQPGEADVVLRVPVAHVEDALVRLADLGTVLDRRLSIVDLEQTLRAERQHILQLRLQVARLNAQLAHPLPTDVRLRLRFLLQQARSELSRVTGAKASTLRQAALSRISLTLTTERAVTTSHKSGTARWERAARDAGSFLAGAGAVALFLLIVLSPFVALVALALLGLRAYRRREERRLLASA